MRTTGLAEATPPCREARESHNQADCECVKFFSEGLSILFADNDWGGVPNSWWPLVFVGYSPYLSRAALAHIDRMLAVFIH